MMKNIVIGVAAAIFIAVIGYSAGYWFSYGVETWTEKNKRVILCRHERPEIYDRSGTLLIGNRERTQQNERLRYAAVDGKFAAAFLGFTELCYSREVGKSGIEKMIDRKQTPGNPVYVSIDCGVQRTVEGWMERLQTFGEYTYMYALCLNSSGELIAAAQRPVLDINNRLQVDGGTCFFPAVYVLPVSEDLMKLLGSSSNAAPEEKEKFRFHCKLGVFFPEARGWIRGVSSSLGAYDQAATSFNYLLAYISVEEQKPLPQFQVFSSGRQPAVVMKNKINWIRVNQDDHRIVALGKAPELNGDRLYFLICVEPEKTENFQKIISEIKKF